MTDVDDRPLILCSNDDGFFSHGLRALAEALSTFARVVVVAPETEQSATSHSLTLHRPLRLRRYAEDRYAVDGTPADCVYLAVHLGESGSATPVLTRKPDLVVSGINRGINLGQDIFYSGTVAAAREGALRGIPSIAASVGVVADESGSYVFEPVWAAELVAKVAQAVLALPKKPGPALLFNLNVPAGPVKGLVATKLGTRLWTEAVDARIDPRGRAYFWLGGHGVEHDQIPGSDTEAYDAGLASLSVLGLDLARHDGEARAAADAVVGSATR
ncbi:MAG: 5'/3'-nucleotidase SurE [Deltaproteobacteria bacterium]|nr:5'/3'-nucleotidase SurE [Deltaproteobacteria bacterium]